ncbi:unnamed protein product [Schistosoma intercalatum]|nr:unnamed protein product [Schistosoma intercalatum]CAH8613908.1 unnamed protein product [Schistosoma intercalatum]
MRVHPSRLVRLSLISLLFLLCIAIIYNKYLDKALSGPHSISQLIRNQDFASVHNVKPFKIDWENYSLTALEGSRVGPGENGMAFELSPLDRELSKKTINENGFSAYVSGKIKTDRSIIDIRHPRCKGKLYSSNLPTASVVIPFFEEHWETLLRTVASVLNRAPS